MKHEKIESALLLIFLLNTLRIYNVTNSLVLTVLALLYICFALMQKYRLIICVFLIFLLLSNILIMRVGDRMRNPSRTYVYDGVIITEESYSTLINGKNPYSHTFNELLNKPLIYPGIIENHAENHYVYSPFMILVNAPIFAVTQNFKVTDMRIGMFLFLFSSAILGLILVKEKVLFAIIFLLNPLFLHSIFDGANEVFILFFMIGCLLFLSKGKISWATIFLSLATATKLLILPFVPLYFLYIYLKSGRQWKPKILRELVIFYGVNLLIYLPFMIWNSRDLVDDLFIYHITGGSSGRPIAGFLGVPQLLVSSGIIGANSRFPFFLLTVPLSVVFLPVAYKILKRHLDLPSLCLLFVGYFLGIFSFSRIIQTDYLAFLSQVLLLAAFL